MKKIVACLAYCVALCAVFFMFFSIIGTGYLAKLIVATGIHPTAWYSGGEEAYTVKEKGYVLTVNHPVFKRVYGVSRAGFVQFSMKGDPSLPAQVEDTIAIDGYHFRFSCDPSKPSAILTETDGCATGVDWAYRFSDKSVVVRVLLKNRK